LATLRNCFHASADSVAGRVRFFGAAAASSVEGLRGAEVGVVISVIPVSVQGPGLAARRLLAFLPERHVIVTALASACMHQGNKSLLMPFFCGSGKPRPTGSRPDHTTAYRTVQCGNGHNDHGRPAQEKGMGNR
jgi:hypothetical protein